MAQKYHSYDNRTFLIYIDSYENGVPVGQFYHPCREEGDSFKSLTQLLLKLNQELDIDNVPQSFNTVRTFLPLSPFWEVKAGNIHPRAGKMATFTVQVLFRRNSSWQGSVTWLEEGRRQSFRSVLELIFLLNSALAGGQDPNSVSFEDYQRLEKAE